MSTLQYLTDNQREFAAEHHELVINFLRRRRLDMNDFYDIVVFGYLSAVQQYDQRPELRQYKFKTIANLRMNAAILKNAMSKQQRILCPYRKALAAA